MIKNYTKFLAKVLTITTLALSVSGCDTLQAFAKKDKSPITANTVITSGKDVPAKAAAIRERELKLQKLEVAANLALNAGNLDVAKEAYDAINEIEPGNLRAAEGLRRIGLRQRHQAILEEAKGMLGKSDIDDDKAAALFRDVLVENPNNAEAAKLYHDLVEQHAAKRAESLHKKLVYQNPVSLEFRDVPIKVIAESLAKGTGVNIILDKDVSSTQKATLFVKSVSLQDAIDVLAQSNQLQSKVLNDKSVIIYPNTLQKLREYQDLVIRSFYLEYADPKIVSGLLKSMLGIKQVQVDDRLPMVMIKDVPDVMVLAEKLIASQDVPDPEVMLEFEVLEIKYSKSLNIGATWPNQLTVLPALVNAGASSSSTLTLSNLLHDIDQKGIAVSPNPSVILSGTDSNANLLANPRLRVKNKEKAKIHIGDRIPVITSTVSSTGVSTENVQYIDVGIKLEAEPNISLGGDVTIKLNLDVGSLGTQSTTKNGSVVFQIGTRNTSTQLRLRDGETQVLAGLINDEDRKTIGKIPGFGDLPLLGRLFSNHSDSKTKNEIVLSVTPHIIRDRSTPRAETSEYWSGSELQVGRASASPSIMSGVPFIAAPAAKAAPTPAATNKPQGLNIPLPAGMTSPLENGPGSKLDDE